MYTYLWYIQKYSHCWHNNREKLVSPVFTAEASEGTAWNLELYPRGRTDEDKGNISICLCRNDDDGPEFFEVNCYLLILAEDGAAIKSRSFTCRGSRNTTFGSWFLKMEEVLFDQKNEFLPDDILTVRCVLFECADVGAVATIYARTRIAVERIDFRLAVESFSSLEPHKKKTFQIQPRSEKVRGISCSVRLSDGSCCERKVIVEITPSDKDHILTQCEISLLGVNGEKIKCAMEDYRLFYQRAEIKRISLSLTNDEIMERKTELLPQDNLYLLFICDFATGIEFQNIECFDRETTQSAMTLVDSNPHVKDIYAAKLSACPSAQDDLKDVYINKFLTDVELKTKTNSFSAHKVVLCARSSVFRAMLVNDTKERNTNSILVNDLEDDTLQQLLLFLYSDKIKDMKLENATKLYYAADYYQIEKLKLMCSSFLVENVTTSSAIELLFLADTHSDSVLKKAAEVFILQHDEQVFGSEKWRDFMETNPQLAVKTMRLKYEIKEGK